MLPVAEASGAAVGAEAPVVDVVVPTYGPTPYLREALSSILAQTHAGWRLTVVDNSPERGEVAGLLAELGDDPRVRYLATGGLGQAANWNAALGSGDAPFVAMLHDDDLWEPTFLATRLQVLAEHPDCAFVFSGYRQIDTAGREIGVRPLRVAPGLLEPRRFVPIQYVANVVPPCALLYRRSAIDALDHPFDPEVPYFDYEFWLRLGSRFPVYAIDTLDYRLRVHEGSVTNALVTAEERRTGRLWLEFLDAVEPFIDHALPGAVSPAARRRRRAGALLTAALDELQAGRRRSAGARLGQALRHRPASALDVRVPTILLLTLVGPRAGRWLARVRQLQHGLQLPAHGRDIYAYLRERWRTRHLHDGSPPSRTSPVLPVAADAVEPAQP